MHRVLYEGHLWTAFKFDLIKQLTELIDVPKPYLKFSSRSVNKIEWFTIQ